MIGRWSSKKAEAEEVEPKGFDAFDLRLGDVMRGERATMGKSLLDVQRELRIKASYIAAIENCDPDAFDTPGFIAGYVRSYARYLGMNPDEAFATFCSESGFEVAHGMSAGASVIKKQTREERLSRKSEPDMFARPATPFTPSEASFLSHIEPAAIGSAAVLVALIGAIGFGGWTVLREVQRVQVTPVDQTPVVLSDLDPLDGALTAGPGTDAPQPAEISTARTEALDRLYRPQALDVPVLVARDAPIATLDPRLVGVFTASVTPETPEVPSFENIREESSLTAAIDDALEGAIVPGVNVPQVVEQPVGAVRMVAAYDSWVSIKAADGTTLYEAIMKAGDVYDVPAMEEPPTLLTGESGALYFAMGAECFGPVGPGGSVTKNLPLHSEALAELYDTVDPAEDRSLTRMMANIQDTLEPSALAKVPCQTR